MLEFDDDIPDSGVVRFIDEHADGQTISRRVTYTHTKAVLRWSDELWTNFTFRRVKRPARERYRCAECNTRRRRTKRQRDRGALCVPFCSKRCAHANETRRALERIDDDDRGMTIVGSRRGTLSIGHGDAP